jgi:hypothetical protein
MRLLEAAYSNQRKTLRPRRRSSLYCWKRASTTRCAKHERKAKPLVTATKGMSARCWMAAIG